MKTINRESMQRTCKLALICSLALLLSAFRSTEVETHTSPGYGDYTFEAVYVQIPVDNVYFEEHVYERLAREFKKSKVRMYTADDLFSPFRSWTEEERTKVLAARGITATLVISLKSASARSSNGVVFFDADMGMATHVQARSDRADFHVRLFDVATTELAWAAIVRTRGNGTLFATDKSAAKAVSKHLAKSLRASGHLLR